MTLPGSITEEDVEREIASSHSGRLGSVSRSRMATVNHHQPPSTTASHRQPALITKMAVVSRQLANKHIALLPFFHCSTLLCGRIASQNVSQLASHCPAYSRFPATGRPGKWRGTWYRHTSLVQQPGTRTVSICISRTVHRPRAAPQHTVCTQYSPLVSGLVHCAP